MQISHHNEAAAFMSGRDKHKKRADVLLRRHTDAGVGVHKEDRGDEKKNLKSGAQNIDMCNHVVHMWPREKQTEAHKIQ